MLKKINKLLSVSCLMLGATFAFNTHAAVIKTDIVMIVDESGSMSAEQTNLRNNIGLFASILSAGGIDARYALMGYGASSVINRIRTLTDFTDPAGFATAALDLEATGGDEDAFDAVAYALNSYASEASSFSYRPDAVKNLIIFTDEPDRNGVHDFAFADNLLTVNNALFNAVLSGTSTIASIGPLATGHGGGVFSLADLGSSNTQVVTDFVTAFANTKLQETIDFCVANPKDPACINVDPKPTNPVPAPPALALFALGLVGLLRKRA